MATSQILFLSFVFHILLLFSLPLETATSETTDEGRALLKWKNTLDFNADVLHSWSIANLHNICWNWTGITCNNDGAVYKIKLNNFNISGTLESLHFLSFPNLTRFSLYNNSFTGSVPCAIANISQLVFLDLSFNYFANSIPSDIGRLTKLRILNLGVNRLVAPTSWKEVFQDHYAIFNHLLKCSFYPTTVCMAQFLNALES
nr:receptor-like protein 12 [Ipomoea batatas]